MEDGMQDMPKPIGDFIIANAEGIMLPDGMYYHYAKVCTLLKLYAKSKLLVEAASEGKVVAEPKADYTTLKAQLLLVAKELDDCGTAATQIEKITDKNSFRRAYKDTFKVVAEKFGIDLDDGSDKIDDLESDKDDLQDEVNELTQKLEGFDGYGKIETIVDEWKARAFAESKDNYTWQEMEELMKNGKDLLIFSHLYKK